MVVTRAGGRWFWEMLNGMNLQLEDKFWRYKTQHSDCSPRYYIINFKFADRLDLNCSHYKKEMIIICHDIIAICKCIKSVGCTP